jgi:hypothetical protein
MMLALAAVLFTAAPRVAADGEQLPSYHAPQHTTPRARVGGTLRAADGDDPAVAALVPDHIGITVKQHPVLNGFLSKPTTLPIKFTLIDERAIRALVEKSIASPAKAGVQAIRLDDIEFELEPNVQYRWYISLIKDTDSPSQDIVTGGMIERCLFSECLFLDAPTTCSREAVMATAAKGFWYDAMACLCDLIESNPTDTHLRRQRVALLRQVGLHEVAEWDLGQSHAGLH